MRRRLTILAGAGALVSEVVEGARTAGDEVQILPLVDRSDLGISEIFKASDLPRLVWRITSFRTTHVAMVGGLKASGAERDAFKRFAGRRASGVASGDAALLKIAEKILAMTGAKVIGAETIIPDILAGRGHIAGPPLDPELLPVAQFALEIARAIGALDIGQAAVVTAGRVISVEDSAGTDVLLARVGRYREEGLDPGLRLVLGKALKPQQSRLVDRPAIGTETIRNAAAAGIVAIAIEAGGAIIVNRAGFTAAAEAAGISVVGVTIDAG